MGPTKKGVNHGEYKSIIKEVKSATNLTCGRCQGPEGQSGHQQLPSNDGLHFFLGCVIDQLRVHQLFAEFLDSRQIGSILTEYQRVASQNPVHNLLVDVPSLNLISLNGEVAEDDRHQILHPAQAAIVVMLIFHQLDDTGKGVRRGHRVRLIRGLRVLANRDQSLHSLGDNLPEHVGSVLRADAQPVHGRLREVRVLGVGELQQRGDDGLQVGLDGLGADLRPVLHEIIERAQRQPLLDVTVPVAEQVQAHGVEDGGKRGHEAQVLLHRRPHGLHHLAQQLLLPLVLGLQLLHLILVVIHLLLLHRHVLPPLERLVEHLLQQVRTPRDHVVRQEVGVARVQTARVALHEAACDLDVRLSLDGVQEVRDQVPQHVPLVQVGGEGGDHEGEDLRCGVPDFRQVRELEEGHDDRRDLLHVLRHPLWDVLQEGLEDGAGQRLVLQQTGLDLDLLVAHALDGEGQGLHALLVVGAVVVLVDIGDGDVRLNGGLLQDVGDHVRQVGTELLSETLGDAGPALQDVLGLGVIRLQLGGQRRVQHLHDLLGVRRKLVLPN
mmetsp:Transcript_133896/g.232365  ORF Transcript_133896/g.232365 Transcript_133896/m.232365 type:complete len:551 (+) Transcript_133896:640-2292(+)